MPRPRLNSNDKFPRKDNNSDKSDKKPFAAFRKNEPKRSDDRDEDRGGEFKREYKPKADFEHRSKPKNQVGDRPNYENLERKPFDRDNSDRPKRSFDGERKPFDRDNSDRPKRAFDGERKPFDRDNTDRPKRSFDGERKPFDRDNTDRPKRSFDGERKPFDRDNTDRPKRSFDGERKPFDRDNTDRPKRSFDGERKPFDRDNTHRPKRSFDGERKPFDRDNTDRPKRSFDGERKPFDRDNTDRPKRSFDGERKPFEREDADRNPVDGEAPKTERKPFDRDNTEKFNRRDARNNDDSSYERKPYAPNKRDTDERNQYGGYENSSFRPKDDPNNPKVYTGKRPSKPQMGADDGLIRLNKYIANAGVCSRRDADELIQRGEITVNGEQMTELGYKVKPNDDVRHNGRRLKREANVYILMNKPKDYITTTEDPQERKTVMSLLKDAASERVYPVGRLDRNTTGLLLFTNDGELAQKLAHPSGQIKKVYQVTLNKPLSKQDFDLISAGIELEDGPVKVDGIGYGKDKHEVGIEIHVGRNRIVRRIFEFLGYDVVYLDRTSYAGLTKKDLPRGKYRYLNEREVVMLKHFTK